MSANQMRTELEAQLNSDINTRTALAEHQQKLNANTSDAKTIDRAQTGLLGYFTFLLGSLAITFKGKNLPKAVYTGVYKAIHHSAPSTAQTGAAVFTYMQAAFSGAAMFFLMFALKNTLNSYKRKKDLEDRIAALAGEADTSYEKKSNATLIGEAIKENGIMWGVALSVTAAVGTAIAHEFNPFAHLGGKGAAHLSALHVVQAVVPGFVFAGVELFTAFMHHQGVKRAEKYLETVSHFEQHVAGSENILNTTNRSSYGFHADNNKPIRTVGDFLDMLALEVHYKQSDAANDTGEDKQDALKLAQDRYNAFMHAYADLHRRSGYSEESTNVKDFIHASKASLIADRSFNQKAKYAHIGFAICIFTAFALAHLAAFTGIGAVVGIAMVAAAITVGFRTFLNKYIKKHDRAKIFEQENAKTGRVDKPAQIAAAFSPIDSGLATNPSSEAGAGSGAGGGTHNRGRSRSESALPTMRTLSSSKVPGTPANKGSGPAGEAKAV